MTITVFHNPACGTSRTVLERLRAAGHEPRVVEYLKEGWTRPQLDSLLAAMNARPRDILRIKALGPDQQHLADPDASDEAILEAMVAHPVLVERPIVAAPAGTRLCRPAERLNELLGPGVAG